MSDFFTQMQQTQTNVSHTENGMKGYKTTFHPLLDMNFKLPSYRGNKKGLIDDLKAVMDSNDSEYLLKYLFYLRDAREGLGERDAFRTALKYICSYDFENKDEIIRTFIDRDIEKFGRFDDLFLFSGTQYSRDVIAKIKSQLSEDFDNMQAGKSISLLAKWMPSENTSSKETVALAKKLIRALGTNAKEYRKLLSTLRAYLKVTEVDTSANKWGEIDYNAVPSKANIKYKNAFLKHDEERRRDYLAALRVGVDKNGEKVKINSSVNFPHEIVNKYILNSGWYCKINNYDEALEQLWKNLKQMPGLDNTIVVRDGSGSMFDTIPKSNVQAIDVATALTLYCAERLTGSFKDKFITFSANAKLIELQEKTLQQRIIRCLKEDDCSNTNIEKVFQLILNTAIQHKIPVADMPKQMLIVSDMEFDPARFKGDTNVFEHMETLFNNAGYQLPKLVFWNVNGRTNTLPIIQNKAGVILVSGFSVNILEMVMSGKTDPFEALVEKLSKERYQNIPLLKLVDTPNVKTKSPERKEFVQKKNIEKPNWL